MFIQQGKLEKIAFVKFINIFLLKTVIKDLSEYLNDQLEEDTFLNEFKFKVRFPWKLRQMTLANQVQELLVISTRYSFDLNQMCLSD